MGSWAKAETAVDPTNLRRSSSKHKLETLPCCLGWLFFLLPSPIILNFQHSDKQRHWGDVSRFISYWVGFLPPSLLRAAATQHTRRDLAFGGKKCKRVLFLFHAVVFISFCKSHKHPLNVGRETTPPGIFWSVGYLPWAPTSMLFDKTPQQKRTKGDTSMFWMTTGSVGNKDKMQTTRRLNTLTGNNTTKQTIISLITTKSFQRKKPHMRQTDQKSSTASVSSDVFIFKATLLLLLLLLLHLNTAMQLTSPGARWVTGKKHRVQIVKFRNLFFWVSLK